MSNDILIVKGLKKYFHSRTSFFLKSKECIKAVDGIQMEIRKGETFGLVGESGCGKTTLGRCILRLEEIDEGEIYFENYPIHLYNQKKIRPLRQDMQMIFQDPFSSLNPRKTAEYIIGEPFVIHGSLSKKEGKERVKYLMEVVGLLPEQRKRYPHEFSGGQRQRICIARAIALNPKFLVADEPVSALDVSIQAQILNLLVKLQQQFKLTYLFISHDLSVVRHISDRVAVMYLGRIVELAPSQILFSRPLHPYTQALISSVPINDPLRKLGGSYLEGDVPSPANLPTGCRFQPRCKYGEQICRQSFPPTQEIEQGHSVECFFPKRDDKRPK